MRIIPRVDHQYMSDRALLTLYLSPKPEQMLRSDNASLSHDNAPEKFAKSVKMGLLRLCFGSRRSPVRIRAPRLM